MISNEDRKYLEYGAKCGLGLDALEGDDGALIASIVEKGFLKMAEIDGEFRYVLTAKGKMAYMRAAANESL